MMLSMTALLSIANNREKTLMVPEKIGRLISDNKQMLDGYLKHSASSLVAFARSHP